MEFPRAHKIASGDLSTANPAGGYLVNADLYVPGMRGLRLEVNLTGITGGTSPSVTPEIVSIGPGGTQITAWQGVALTAPGAAAVATSATSSPPSAAGNTKAYGDRPVRVRPYINTAGAPTGLAGTWELWAFE